MNLSRSTIAGLVAVVLFAPALRADPPPHARWELTFRDEFEGRTVNWKTWESEAGSRGAEHLEGRWPENNLVRDGVLYQVTRKEAQPRAGKQWSTAHIWTRHFQQQYGYFEARMRYGRYLNNAFWLFRPLSRRFPDPPHIEIDINEGHTPRDVCMTFHYYFADPITKLRDRWATGKTWAAPLDLEADFHIFAAEWNREAIVWYFDGQPVRRLENRWAHAPADVRLSTVIMDRHLQKDGASLDSMDGVSMAVDWVRVYQKKQDKFQPQLPPMEPCQLPQPVDRDPQVATDGTKTVILREDFQAGAEGGLPDGWRIGDGHPAIALEKPLPGRKLTSGSKVLKLEPGDYAFRMFDKPITGRLEIELDCYGSRSKDGLLLATLGNFDPDAARSLVNSYYTGNVGAYIHWKPRMLYFYAEPDKWTPFAVWVGGYWNHFRFLLDVPHSAFDAYGGKEGGEFLGGGPFRSRQKECRGIVLRHHGRSDAVYVDNLVVRAVDQ